MGYVCIMQLVSERTLPVFSFFKAKARRQPKAVKPRKMIRLETRLVMYAACNNGSSAVVTKEGQLFIFGKDTTFCDQSSGKA